MKRKEMFSRLFLMIATVASMLLLFACKGAGTGGGAKESEHTIKFYLQSTCG